MIKLMNALREKHRSPQAALRALGLDEALLLRENDKEPMDEREKAIRAGLKLAQDASLSEITDFLKAVPASEGGATSQDPEGFGEREDDGEDEIPGVVTEPNAGAPAGVEGEKHEGKEVAHDEPAAASHAILMDKCSPEELAKIGELLKKIAMPEGDEDNEGEAEGKEHGEHEPDEGEDEDSEEDDAEGQDEDKEEMSKDLVTRPAMDEAIKVAVANAEKRGVERAKAIRKAEREVRPLVGDLAMDAASADDVYRQALIMLGVKGAEKVDASAFPVLLEMASVSATQNRPKREVNLGMDSAASDSFNKMFPNASRITLAH